MNLDSACSRIIICRCIMKKLIIKTDKDFYYPGEEVNGTIIIKTKKLLLKFLKNSLLIISLKLNSVITW